MGVFMAGLTTRLDNTNSLIDHGAIAVIIFSSFVLTGCNSETIVTPDSQLRISPDATSFDIVEFRDPAGNCVFSTDFYQDVPVSIVLVDSLNRSLGNTPVTVYADFTGNTFSGPEALQIFIDNNGNAVVDNIDELVSGVGDDAVSIRTDDDFGRVDLLVRVNLSCSYRGNLYAFAGPAAASVSFSVNDISEPPEEDVQLSEELTDLMETTL